MLSYLHAFHAGNHADILKHMALVQLIKKLNQKPTPYSFFDTHAGSALYSLQGEKARKTGEAQKGILALDTFAKKNGEELPAALKDYLSLVNPYLEKDLYPGSPLIERVLLGKDSFHSICELHPSEYESLKENFLSPILGSERKDDYAKTQISKADGLKTFLAQTPPKIKRGAAIIDPSYEEASDYEAVKKTVIAAHKKWSVGTIMIWFPLLSHRASQIEGMLESICAAAKVQNANTNILRADFCVDNPQSHIETSLEENAAQNPNAPRLYGSGILLLNSPWKLDQDLEESLGFLQNHSIFEKAPTYSITKI